MNHLHLPSRVVAVAGVLALALAACGGGGEDQTIEPSPEGTAAATSTPAVTPSPVEEDRVPEAPVPQAGADCSAGELVVQEVEPQGLSDAAAETYRDVRQAALACDYERLAEIAPDEGFEYSFGGAEAPAPYWRQLESAGERPMAELVGILDLPATEDDDGNFVWPRVHVEPENDEAWQELLEVYPPEAVEEWREGGAGYLGYRTAISPEGEWLYFVAGD